MILPYFAAGGTDGSARMLAAAVEPEPGSLRWGHYGVGAAPNVAGQSFLNANDVWATGVPLQGGGSIRAAVIGGPVDFNVVGIQQAAGSENGLREMGFLPPERNDVASDVSTMAEQRFEYLEVSSPIMIFASQGIDPGILFSMKPLFEQAATSPFFVAALAELGSVPKSPGSGGARARLEGLPRCLIPRFDGGILSQSWKEGLWDKLVMATPRPRTPSEL